MSTSFFENFPFFTGSLWHLTTKVVNNHLSKGNFSGKVKNEKAQARHLGHENENLRSGDTSIFIRIAGLDFNYNTKSYETV